MSGFPRVEVVGNVLYIEPTQVTTHRVARHAVHQITTHAPAGSRTGWRLEVVGPTMHHRIDLPSTDDDTGRLITMFRAIEAWFEG